jgi:hypothetical protein
MCILDIPPVNPALVTSSDNCTSSITLSHLNDVVSGVVCLNRFNVIRTYVGSDDCGNSSSCTQVITVFDNTPPALTCPANTTVECASLVPIPTRPLSRQQIIALEEVQCLLSAMVFQIRLVATDLI